MTRERRRRDSNTPTYTRRWRCSGGVASTHAVDAKLEAALTAAGVTVELLADYRSAEELCSDVKELGHTLAKPAARRLLKAASALRPGAAEQLRGASAPPKGAAAKAVSELLDVDSDPMNYELYGLSDLQRRTHTRENLRRAEKGLPPQPYEPAPLPPFPTSSKSDK